MENDKMDNRTLTYCNLDLVDYKEAWELQKQLFELRYRKSINDTLLLLEHPHTYTLGKVAERKNLTGSEEFLKEKNISIFDIDRGGDITYHGPGQVVGYPVINLGGWHQDTHKYLRALEEVIIRTCNDYNLTTERVPDYTGVWTNKRKIAAIGIKISRWITMHGFAFNVNTDLSLFTGIIPCGIPDKEVTSLQKELGRTIEIEEVKAKLLKHFIDIFNYSSSVELNKDELLNLDHHQVLTELK
jgi:lipoyl(octanoyl) transferase